MVSIKDVAQHARVSVGTVSNVLNHPDRVSPATVARVQYAIRSLGFVRNDAARQLRAGSSRAIGLVVLDLRNPFFAEVASGAEQYAATHGLSLLISSSDQDHDRESAYLDLFEQQRAFGLLVTPAREDVSYLSRLNDRGVPTVLVDRQSDIASLSSVAVDDVSGGRMAVEHLIAIGRRRLAFVGGPADLRQVTDRFAGAAAAARDAGIALDPIHADELTVEEGRRVGSLLSADPPRRPDGIFAANDLVALGLLQSLLLRDDMRVPGDVAVIGYDDIDYAATAAIALTSVRQPARQIGRTAAELLVSIRRDRSGSQQIVFQPELIVRRSTMNDP